jgi:FixJ family two-component response regulator
MAGLRGQCHKNDAKLANVPEVCCCCSLYAYAFGPADEVLGMVPVIAIVDDDESFRRATMSFIRSLGYAVLQFASAEAFLKSDLLHDTNCLISDVQMPGMNGVELQGELNARGHHLPIIFVTAFSEMRAKAQALAAGAIGFLDKPFSDEELIACLNKALAGN